MKQRPEKLEECQHPAGGMSVTCSTPGRPNRSSALQSLLLTFFRWSCAFCPFKFPRVSTENTEPVDDNNEEADISAQTEQTHGKISTRSSGFLLLVRRLFSWLSRGSCCRLIDWLHWLRLVTQPLTTTRNVIHSNQWRFSVSQNSVVLNGNKMSNMQMSVNLNTWAMSAYWFPCNGSRKHKWHVDRPFSVGRWCFVQIN